MRHRTPALDAFPGVFERGRAQPARLPGALRLTRCGNDTPTVMYRLHELANFHRDNGGGAMPGTMALLPE